MGNKPHVSQDSQDGSHNRLSAISVVATGDISSKLRPLQTISCNRRELEMQPQRDAAASCNSVDPPMDREFESFATTAIPQLLRFARRLTGDGYLADDLVQDALCKVGKRWASIESSDEEGRYRYALSTLMNCFRSERRRAWRRRERSVAFPPPSLAESSRSAESRPIAPLSDELGQLLQRIPPRQRAVVLLRYYLDYSEEDTARLLRCSRGTVKSQAARGLLRLRTVTVGLRSATG